MKKEIIIAIIMITISLAGIFYMLKFMSQDPNGENSPCPNVTRTSIFSGCGGIAMGGSSGDIKLGISTRGDIVFIP